MKGEQKQISKAAEKVGKKAKKASSENVKAAASKVVSQGMVPKDAMGLSDAMVEGIYGQAYRLYNTGKFREAGQLFRLLIMLNSGESKYSMGLAACLHMLKEYKASVEAYMLCSVIDPKSPIPHYHASDCYLQMKDKASALIALKMALKRCGNKPEFKTLKDRAKLTIENLEKELEEAAPQAAKEDTEIVKEREKKKEK